MKLNFSRNTKPKKRSLGKILNLNNSKTLSVREAMKYPLFKIPLIFLSGCLIIAALGGLLGLGKPQIDVAIALDLSGSTYNNQTEQFNQPETILNKQVQAVQAYLKYNQDKLRKPNEIKVYGFAGNVLPLSRAFTTQSQETLNQLNQNLQNPNLIEEINPGATNLDLAISEGVNALSHTSDSCRELLLVTDGIGSISPDVITQALSNRVKVNVVLIGEDAPHLRQAALATEGIYLSEEADNLSALFTEQLFIRFNSNLPWIIFWLGGAWLSLMWLLCLPLNRLLFQRLMDKNWHQASKYALYHALFWTVATPLIVWSLAGGIPFISRC